LFFFLCIFKTLFGSNITFLVTTCQGKFPWVEGTYQCWLNIYFWLSINHGINHGTGCLDCQAWIDKKHTIPYMGGLFFYDTNVMFVFRHVLCFVKWQDALGANIYRTHQCRTSRFKLEVRNLGYIFCFEGYWCEKCCFLLNFN
jgi:hypothetical protein